MAEDELRCDADQGKRKNRAHDGLQSRGDSASSAHVDVVCRTSSPTGADSAGR